MVEVAMAVKKLARNAKNGRFIDPSSPEAAKKFAKDARSFVSTHTQTQAAARAVLIDLGIYTESGRLTAKYKTVKASKKK